MVDRQDTGPRPHAPGSSLALSRATPLDVAEAASLLRRGELVVLPTETVYGLAGDASRPSSIAHIYQAKGRPSKRPLIVHILPEWLETVAQAPSEAAQRLAERFWPGPLTLILPRADAVCEEAAGGLATVGVRMPNHPLALDVLRDSKLALAMPSANRYTALSPTRVEDLEPQILAAAAKVLDGGPCQVGIESTVLDLTADGPAQILRPGAVTAAQLAEVLGYEPLTRGGSEKSPGTDARHYSPRTPLSIVPELEPGMPGITLGQPSEHQIQLPSDPERYAAMLYATLHALDRQGHTEIFVQAPPKTTAWGAIWDRLRRAAASSEVEPT